jgi:hypothetical protein
MPRSAIAAHPAMKIHPRQGHRIIFANRAVKHND